MTESMDKYTDILAKKQISPSIQRVCVLRFLDLHRVHPTVEEIYLAVKKQLPTLSKTTVYNVLELLEGKKIIKSISGRTVESILILIAMRTGISSVSVAGAFLMLMKTMCIGGLMLQRSGLKILSSLKSGRICSIVLCRFPRIIDSSRSAPTAI